MEQHDLCYVLLLHPVARKVFLLETADGWTLPSFPRTPHVPWACVADVNQAMQAQLGVATRTIRCLQTQYHPQCAQYYYVAEYGDPAWHPPRPSRWVTPGEMGTLLPAMPEASSLAATWFAWEEADTPRRVAWYRRGWAVAALAWMRQQVAGMGRTLRAPIEQLRTSQRATLYRIPTAEGALYFKAVPPCFRHEIALTRYLGTLFPGEIPRVVAENPTSPWLLMDDAGSTSLDACSDLARWSRMVHRYAEMQVALVPQRAALLQVGCQERAPSNYAEVIPQLIAEVARTRPGDDEIRLSDAEIGQLQQLIPALVDLARALPSSAVPYTLEHGDLWSGQVLLNEERFVFLDWSDASLSHPFFSMFLYLCTEEIPARFATLPHATATVCEAYLDPWSRFVTPAHLHELWQRAGALAPIHFAARYSQVLLPTLEVPWEMANFVPYLLRRLLGMVW